MHTIVLKDGVRFYKTKAHYYSLPLTKERILTDI